MDSTDVGFLVMSALIPHVILRYTSGVTPTDSLEVSMAAEPFRSRTCIHKHWWGFEPMTVCAAEI